MTSLSLRECNTQFENLSNGPLRTIELDWEGEGVDEKGYDRATGKMLVCVNPAFYRPTDVVDLWGDPTKAKTVLGWDPQKTTCEELCRIMVEHDLEQAKREAKFNS